MRAILSEATLRYYMKHCNFRFDESKAEWTPKKDQSADKTDKMTEENDPISETAEEDGSFEIEL